MAVGFKSPCDPPSQQLGMLIQMFGFRLDFVSASLIKMFYDASCSNDMS